MVPPIFKVAPSAIVSVPPATVIPRFAVNDARSSVPATTVMLPPVAVVEFRAGRFAVKDLVVPPLIRKVPYVIKLLTV